jgi:hypothetical protein
MVHRPMCYDRDDTSERIDWRFVCVSCRVRSPIRYLAALTMSEVFSKRFNASTMSCAVHSGDGRGGNLIMR